MYIIKKKNKVYMYAINILSVVRIIRYGMKKPP